MSMLKVAIVGSGVIGITSALLIQKTLQDRTKITIYTSETTPNTTSDVAAGLWFPYLVQDTPEDKIVRWSKSTYDYLLDLWQRGEAHNAGLTLQNLTKLSNDPNFKLPKWVSEVTLGYSELTPQQLSHYQNLYNEPLTGGFTFMTFTWEGSKFLPYLSQLLDDCEIIIAPITNLEDLARDFDVVVNCAGLGSRVLVPDPEVQPIRGQIIRLEAPWQCETFFGPVANCYVIPNQEFVVLGGTSQVEDWNLDTDPKDSEDIWRRCLKYIPALEGARVLEHKVGLRPGRCSVRLSHEDLVLGDGRVMKLVHNYGHGGSGVTLSIGCGEEVAGFVGEFWSSKNRVTCKL